MQIRNSPIARFLQTLPSPLLIMALLAIAICIDTLGHKYNFIMNGAGWIIAPLTAWLFSNTLQNKPIRFPDWQMDWVIYALSAVLLAAGILLAKRWGEWTIQFVLLTSFALAPLAAAKFKKNIQIPQWIFILSMGAALLALCPLIGALLKLFHKHGAAISVTLVPIISLLIIFRCSLDKQSAAIMFAYSLLMTSAMVTLQNWLLITDLFPKNPATTCFLLALFTGIATRLCFDPKQLTFHQALRPLPYTIFAVMACRTDSLFTAGSQMHWQYFVGPIQTIRDGGWLLWDTPAQYGFLNILLPSLIPMHSAWDAFYIFQAIVLFAASILLYRALHKHLGTGRLLACMLTFTAFFLAWPDPLIGPAPYPSSSAVRFLWCYVMLYWAVKIFSAPKPSINYYAHYGVWLWVPAVLWSAESAVYATTIFFAPIALHIYLLILKRAGPNKILLETFDLLKFPLATLVASLILINLYYKIQLGHWPDWSMFGMYAFAYAGGFGSMPLTIYGPMWIYGFLLFVGTCGLRAQLQENLSAESFSGAIISAMACIWAIASYYIGRAVPNNIIAEFGMLCLVMMIFLRNASQHVSRLAICLPILMLAFIGPLWNVNFITFAIPIEHFIPTLPSHLVAQAPASLDPLLKKANIKIDNPVSYYGYDTFMPASAGLTYENTWLAAPMQLLEEPIPPAVRIKLLQRYLDRHTKPGYIVQKQNEFADRMDQWMALLSQTYDVKQTWNNGTYRIIYFVPRVQK